MAEMGQQDFDTTLMTSADGLQLNRAFFRIKDASVRRRVIDLVKSIAESGDAD